MANNADWLRQIYNEQTRIYTHRMIAYSSPLSGRIVITLITQKLGMRNMPGQGKIWRIGHAPNT